MLDVPVELRQAGQTVTQAIGETIDDAENQGAPTMDTIKRLLRLAIVCQMIAFAANAAWSQTTAVRANDFLNTIGVNTGICYGSDSATTDATLINNLASEKFGTTITMILAAHRSLFRFINRPALDSISYRPNPWAKAT